jgi:hypothetical protein
VFDGPRRKATTVWSWGMKQRFARGETKVAEWAIEDRMRCALRDVPRRRITLVVNGNERNNPSCERIRRYRPTKAGIIRIGMFRIADDLLLDDLSLNLSIDELRIPVYRSATESSRCIRRAASASPWAIARRYQIDAISQSGCMPTTCLSARYVGS